MNSTQQTCHYRVLEVDPGASRSTVEQAYQRLSQIFGPTSLAVYGLVDDAQQQRMLEAIEAAFRTLGDPATRAAYDDARGHPPPPETRAEAESVMVEPILLGDEHIEVVVDAEAPQFSSAAEEPESPEASLLPAAPGGPHAEADIVIPQGLASEAEHPAAQAAGPSPEASESEGSESPAVPQEAQGRAAEEPPPLPPMPALDADTAFTGDILRAVREARGLSLEQIAARTRITTTHLGNIELERWDWLPERVFLRGFLISFARELKLDPAKVSETYLARRDGSR